MTIKLAWQIVGRLTGIALMIGTAWASVIGLVLLLEAAGL